MGRRNEYRWAHDMPPILIPEREYRKGEAVFRAATDFTFLLAPAEETALAEAVLRERARATIAGMTPYTGPLYRALREAAGGESALIARFGVGHDNIDKQLARENGILVCNTPGVLDRSVAEHTLWLIG